MNNELSAELLRDALRDSKFIEFNYGVRLQPNDAIFSILCAFTAKSICKDYIDFKGGH